MPATARRLSRERGSPFGATSRRREDTPTTSSTWETRSAVINDERGEPVFEQHDIEVPTTWSQTATNIVASKYFRGQLGSPDRERSVRGLISRVVDTIRAWARQPGLLRHRRGPRRLLRRADPPPRRAEGGLQQPGLVQRGHREAPPGLGLLHQLRPGHDGVDPGPGPHRGDALQVRLGHRLEPLRRSAPRASRWPAAAPPPGRSPSCAATTPSPASSRAAARPDARRRW